MRPQKKPNNFGLFDMHGNLWGWCQDVYSDTADYQQNVTVTNPSAGRKSTYDWVLRGGSWWYNAVPVVHDNTCVSQQPCRAGSQMHNAVNHNVVSQLIAATRVVLPCICHPRKNMQFLGGNAHRHMGVIDRVQR